MYVNYKLRLITTKNNYNGTTKKVHKRFRTAKLKINYLNSYLIWITDLFNDQVYLD